MFGRIQMIGHRKAVIATLLICIVAFSVTWALFRTESSLALLTTPPPGIPGPYYVSTESKIYGPVVSLAAIKSKTGGTYADDYTYVQWGTNPFYRIYIDNTCQEIYFGQMVDVMDRISWRIGSSPPYVNTLENDLTNTYKSLMNNGAIDTTSVLGAISFFGNLPGVYLAMFIQLYALIGPVSHFLNMSTSQLYCIEAGGYGWAWPNNNLIVRLNGTTVISLDFANGDDNSHAKSINASGVMDGRLGVNMTFSNPNYPPGNYYLYDWTSVTFYLEDLSLPLETTLPSSAYRVYTIIDSPGTGFVSKSVSPSSPLIGSTVDLLIKLDPPAANNVNLTDLYPNSFVWSGGQVTLKKFRVGVGLVAETSLSLIPTPVGSNMKVFISFDRAPTVLQSLLSDEYIHMSYTLTAPSASGEYTLSSATMTCSTPLPET